MPIANCTISSKCIKNLQGSTDLVGLWANESGISSEQMTINIITNHNQFGNNYEVMANLLLPSIWSSTDISSIQVGLAKALAIYFEISVKAVHVITNIVDSGMVVEDGKEIQWQD